MLRLKGIAQAAMAAATRAKEEDEHGDEFFDERYEGEIEEQAAILDAQTVVKGELQTLDRLLAMPVKKDHKLGELIRLVEQVTKESPRGEAEKILIFTEYRQTQEYLVRDLERSYGKGCVVVINGGMKLERREETEGGLDAIWEPFRRHGAMEAPTTKRTSQRLFRDHEKVRFLVSTEAGGEGINLQFCHICVNYDIPWNPMRVEQRVGRVYRYGQTKVVQVYNFLSKGTIEDAVQACFEHRVRQAARAIAQVTGEDPEDIQSSLNGQLESEIDPSRIYQRAMVEGNLNKQTEKEITEAVGRAKRAYEIATQSLFRDVSSYSFDNYQRELATDLTLDDLQRFTERFLAMNRRQVQRKSGLMEFIVPEPLRDEDVPERIERGTFDRQTAIARSDVEFLALGHPFVDAMLAQVGSYDFGGLTARRVIKSEKLRGKTGFLYVFVVRHRITREDADEYMFQFVPVFVTAEGAIDESACMPAVLSEGSDMSGPGDTVPDATVAMASARAWAEQKADLWDWADDVEFVAMSWNVFV